MYNFTPSSKKKFSQECYDSNNVLVLVFRPRENIEDHFAQTSYIHSIILARKHSSFHEDLGTTYATY